MIDTSDGSTLQAFQIDLGAVADESDLAAQIDAALGALGSAAVTAGGNLEITLANAGQGLALAEGDSSITLTDAAGRARDYGLAHYLGLNDLVVERRPPGERLRGARRPRGRSRAARAPRGSTSLPARRSPRPSAAPATIAAPRRSPTR